MGHEVEAVSSAEDALKAAERNQPDAIVLDVRLPGADGLTAMPQLRRHVGQAPIVVITAHGDLQTAVTAVRNGAFEYILKPFDLDSVERTLRRALEREQPSARASRDPERRVGGLVGKSSAMQDVYTRIALAAASDSGVLLTGESGVGKELAARAIHQFSKRSDGPFVAVNVAALSPSLAESELFGHAQGAFTGADSRRVGLLEQASGGTLFLDEVADIPLPTQVKLLRALEHGEVTPVGAGRAAPTDFRIISATHQDLAQCVQAGGFRHDLFFRLRAFCVELPPLRNRREDIRELAEHFLASMSWPGAPAPGLSAAALAELESRPWWGNVRELRNALEHAVIVARRGVIDQEHLPPPAASPTILAADKDQSLAVSVREPVRRWAETALNQDDGATDLHQQLLQAVEPPLFRAAIERFHGNCATAARRLGLHRTTLRKKLDQYGID